MSYRDPLKQILSQTRSHWDREQTRPSVRRAFRKALQCRTPVIKRAFGKDPLFDNNGNRMKWVRRLLPEPLSKA